MITIKSSHNPLFAVSCLMQATKLASETQLRAFLIVPLIINTVLYSLAFVIGYHSVSALIHEFVPDWLSWLNWLLWPIFFVSFLIVGFFTFTLLSNLIAAPFYSRLSAKTLQVLNGDNPNTASEQAWQKVIAAELKRSAYLLVRILPLILLFFIPVLNLIAPLAWAIFAAWGLAMEFLAYPLEEHGLLFSEQKQFLQKHRLSAFCLGAIIAVGMTLPLINFFICQIAVIAASIFVHDSDLYLSEED